MENHTNIGIHNTLQDSMDAEQYQRAFGNLKKKKPSARKHEEHTLQMQCNKIFSLRYSQLWRLFAMNKNDGQKKTITTDSGKQISISAIRDKSAGLVPGVADHTLHIANKYYSSLHVEFKIGNNPQSENQKKWQQLVEAAGSKYVIIKTTTEWDTILTDYMSSVDPFVLEKLKALGDYLDKL